MPLTLLVEGGLFAAGVLVYARATRPADRAERRARWGLPTLVAFLLLVHAVIAFGPPPPEGAPPLAFAGPALALWILVAWAARVDRARCAARVA